MKYRRRTGTIVKDKCINLKLISVTRGKNTENCQKIRLVKTNTRNKMEIQELIQNYAVSKGCHG